MTQVLIVNNTVMAFGPFQSDDYSVVGPDLIFPKNLSSNWEILEVSLPEDAVISDYTFDGTTVIKTPSITTSELPSVVSPRQIRQALSRANLRETVESAIASGDQDTKDWYEYATSFERTNVYVSTMGKALGVSDSQLDDLWRLAGSL